MVQSTFPIVRVALEGLNAPPKSVNLYGLSYDEGALLLVAKLFHDSRNAIAMVLHSRTA